MFTKDEVLDELKYIDSNLEFSPKCSIELQNHIQRNGLAFYHDELLHLTNAGEIQIGHEEVTDEDTSEGFFYLDEEENE